jgi:hypothetical protein
MIFLTFLDSCIKMHGPNIPRIHTANVLSTHYLMLHGPNHDNYKSEFHHKRKFEQIQNHLKYRNENTKKRV